MRILAHLVALFAALSPACAAVQPTYSLDILSLAPPAEMHPSGQLLFLTDRRLAVAICYQLGCNLQTFELQDRQARKIGEATNIDHFRQLLRADDGRLILGGARRNRENGMIVSDAFLRDSRFIPKTSGESIPRTNLTSRYASLIQHKFKKVPGTLGWKIRICEDGTRLLSDSFVRKVGTVQGLKDKFEEIVSMGMSADGYAPNSEVVRVVDTTSGHKCFEWVGREELLPAFDDHADIDPSGQLVAVMTRGTVFVFRLPNSCKPN